MNQGYNALCYSRCIDITQAINESYNGTGSSTRNFTIRVPSSEWTMCERAKKADASGSTLILQVSSAKNETPLPFGTVSACVEEALA